MPPSGDGNDPDDKNKKVEHKENLESIEVMRAQLTEKIRQEAGDILGDEDPEQATLAFDATLASELNGNVDSYYGEACSKVDQVLPRVVSEVRGGIADDAMFTQVAEAASVPSAHYSPNPAHDLGMELAFAVIDESETLTQKNEEKRADAVKRRLEETPEDARHREIVQGVLTRRRAERTLDPEVEATNDKIDAIRTFLDGNEAPPGTTKHQ